MTGLVESMNLRTTVLRDIDGRGRIDVELEPGAKQSYLDLLADNESNQEEELAVFELDEQGRLALLSSMGVDEKVLDFFPDMKDIANLDERKKAITIRDLASMSAGMDCSGLPDEKTVKARADLLAK